MWVSEECVQWGVGGNVGSVWGALFVRGWSEVV